MDLNMSWGKGPGKGNHMTLGTARNTTQPISALAARACELEYDLGRRFLLFYTTVGIDHEVDHGGKGPHGNVTFQVWAASTSNPGPQDYHLLREIKNLTSKTPAVAVRLDVERV